LAGNRARPYVVGTIWALEESGVKPKNVIGAIQFVAWRVGEAGELNRRMKVTRDVLDNLS
jgi:hypothetical protein